MTRDIFTGPESIEILEGSLAEGWTADADPESQMVTFRFPLPTDCDQRQVSLEVAHDLYAKDYHDSGSVGFESRMQEELGEYVTYLTVSTPWPISTELVLHLDKVSQKILELG